MRLYSNFCSPSISSRGRKRIPTQRFCLDEKEKVLMRPVRAANSQKKLVSKKRKILRRNLAAVPANSARRPKVRSSCSLQAVFCSKGRSRCTSTLHISHEASSRDCFNPQNPFSWRNPLRLVPIRTGNKLHLNLQPETVPVKIEFNENEKKPSFRSDVGSSSEDKQGTLVPLIPNLEEIAPETSQKAHATIFKAPVITRTSFVPKLQQQQQYPFRITIGRNSNPIRSSNVLYVATQPNPFWKGLHLVATRGQANVKQE